MNGLSESWWLKDGLKTELIREMRGMRSKDKHDCNCINVEIHLFYKSIKTEI